MCIFIHRKGEKPQQTPKVVTSKQGYLQTVKEKGLAVNAGRLEKRSLTQTQSPK
jgi:hypothetical protein